jgi:proteasome beta subunit
MTRRIFPVVAVVTESGYHRMADEEIAAVADRLVGARMQRPDGPAAPLV